MAKQKILINKHMIDEVIAEATQKITKTTKQGWWSRLLDKTNDTVSSSTFMAITLIGVGLLLLFVPVFTLCIEAWYNHTITTDLTGMAAYIGAVTTIFTVAAGLKGWVSHNDSKTKIAEMESSSSYEIDTEENG